MRMDWLGLTASVLVAASGEPLLAQTTPFGGTATGGSTGGGTTGQSSTQPTLAEVQAPPTILAPSQVQTTSQALSPSNFLAKTYANPYYQGRAGAQLTDPPGGFGVPLYSTTGTGTTGISGQGRTGFGSGTTFGASGSTGFTRTGATAGSTAAGFSGIGGQTGTGGLTGSGGLPGTTGGRPGGTFGGGGLGGTQLGRSAMNSGNPSVLVPLPRPISYQAVVKFRPAPATAPAVLQADLQSLVARTPFLSNPAAVQVLTQGEEVVLRGTVADPDEARLIEGMIRLTPGVKAIRNELAIRSE